MTTQDLHQHLASGQTRVCHCWAVERMDGTIYGFTDHDAPLEFDGIWFAADSGLSAKALASSTGLSVNNTEAVGLLQSDVISDADIAAGRFDGAIVTNWLVQWDNVEARKLKFRGAIGEIRRANGAFEAELRGLTDALNQPQGRSYLKTCSAVLGDGACRFDTSDPTYSVEATVASIEEGTALKLPISGFNEGWFSHGVIEVLSGAAEGLRGAVKSDRLGGGLREITLWSAFGTDLSIGDQVRLIAGCDKRAETCREKFQNFENYQGFPHIPGDDWLVSVPRGNANSEGESLFT